MNAPAVEARGSRADSWDVLAVDEEGVLSSIREIVMALRTRIVGVQVADVERALIAAGGVRLGEKSVPGINAFELRGVCFSIASAACCPGSIEVDFIAPADE